MLKTILIDPNPQRRQQLVARLQGLRQDLQIVALVTDLDAAIADIRALTPQLLIVQTSPPEEPLFRKLEVLKPFFFDLVVLAEQDTHATRAFELGALDYLVQPFSDERLTAAIDRVQHRQTPGFSAHEIEMLLYSIRVSTEKMPNIPIPTLSGYEFLPVSDIVYAEADGGYTHIFLKDGRKITLSKTLKEFEDMLDGHAVIRTHQSYLAHIPYIQRFVKGQAPYLIMSTGHKIEISRALRARVLQVLLRQGNNKRE